MVMINIESAQKNTTFACLGCLSAAMFTQVLCSLVSADVARQAWLAQAGALPMLQRLTLAQAAARQRSSDPGSEAFSATPDGRGAAAEDDEAVVPGSLSLNLQKQVNKYLSQKVCAVTKYAVGEGQRCRILVCGAEYAMRIGTEHSMACLQTARLLALISTDAAAEPALRSGPWVRFLSEAVMSDDCMLASDAARALLNMRSAAAAAAATAPVPPAEKCVSHIMRQIGFISHHQ